MTASTDRIEKIVILDAPRSRVWRAITDHAQFGRWFGATLASAFAPGAAIGGKMNHPKCAHLTLNERGWTSQAENLQRFLAA